MAFRPGGGDGGKLSVYDGDVFSPAESHRYHRQALKLASVGVMTVTVAECEANALPAGPDYGEFYGHALIDFSSFSAGEQRRKGEILKALALARGWTFRDGDEPEDDDYEA